MFIRVDEAELADDGHVVGQVQNFQFLGGWQSRGQAIGEVALWVAERGERLWCTPSDLGASSQRAACRYLRWIVRPGQLDRITVMPEQPFPQYGRAVAGEVESLGDLGGWSDLGYSSFDVGFRCAADTEPARG